MVGIPFGASLNEPHTSEKCSVVNLAQKYDKNQVTYVFVLCEFNGIDTEHPYMACVIVHATISEQCSL